MGFLSRVWKGIKKGFKAIFKPIKKVFKVFGKFMNKIGIVGQIAMMFIPFGQILGPLMKGFAQFGGKFLTGLSKMGSLGNAAATVIGKGVEFAKFAKAGFDTVTNAVTGFFKTTGKWIGGKLGMTKFKGLTWDKAWGDYSKSLVDSWDNLGSKAAEFWDTDIKGATVEYNKSVAARAAVDSSVKDTVQKGLDSGLFETTPDNVDFASKTSIDRAVDSGLVNPVDAGYTDMSIPDTATSSTAVDAPKSLLDKTVQFGRELPGNTAKGVATSMASQYAMGAIQGEPEIDDSPYWGARVGPEIPNYSAPIAVLGTQSPEYMPYSAAVFQDTYNTSLPKMYQNYLGADMYQQLMAKLTVPQPSAGMK